jgi:hypothetical protein
MTSSDFGATTGIDRSAVERRIAGVRSMLAPWHDEDAAADGIGYAVCAIDARGVFCGLLYRRPSASLSVDDLELEAPLAAVPVRRGVSRTQPGARLAAPAPLALLKDPHGQLSEIIAAPGAARLDEQLLGSPPLQLRRSLDGEQVEMSRL